MGAELLWNVGYPPLSQLFKLLLSFSPSNVHPRLRWERLWLEFWLWLGTRSLTGESTTVLFCLHQIWKPRRTIYNWNNAKLPTQNCGRNGILSWWVHFCTGTVQYSLYRCILTLPCCLVPLHTTLITCCCMAVWQKWSIWLALAA